jgi:hypothetical protein
MKKSILFFLILLYIILIDNSCQKKCEKENIGNVTFTSNDLKIEPYTGNETLMFLDSLKDTIIYVPEIGLQASGKYDYMSGYTSQNPNDNNQCTGNYYYSEVTGTHFSGKDPSNFGIWFDLRFSGSLFNKNLKKIIDIVVGYKDYNDWFFDQTYYFDGLNLQQPTEPNNSSLSFKDSLKIGPKKFHSVYILKQIQDPYKLANLQYVYYTIKEGIVGFKTKDGHTWYLN